MEKCDSCSRELRGIPSPAFVSKKAVNIRVLSKRQLNTNARHSAPFAMSLTLSDVKRIAHLAQLEMADDQAVTSLAQLNKIFALAEQMQAVNTDGVAPLSHPLAAHMDNIALRLREDVATETNHRDAYQAVAPKVQDGLYLVPKVIE